HGGAAALAGHDPAGGQHLRAPAQEVGLVQPVVLGLGIRALVGQVDEHDVVTQSAFLRLGEKVPSVPVMQADRALVRLRGGQVVGGVAVGQVLGAQAHRLGVDVDVVDAGGPVRHGHRTGHALARTDD